MAAFLNFSKTYKKSPAHLHIVGNVIVEFELFLMLGFKVLAPTKNLSWTPAAILNFLAFLKNHLHIPMLLGM